LFWYQLPVPWASSLRRNPFIVHLTKQQAFLSAALLIWLESSIRLGVGKSFISKIIIWLLCTILIKQVCASLGTKKNENAAIFRKNVAVTIAQIKLL